MAYNTPTLLQSEELSAPWNDSLEDLYPYLCRPKKPSKK